MLMDTQLYILYTLVEFLLLRLVIYQALCLWCLAQYIIVKHYFLITHINLLIFDHHSNNCTV